MSHCYFCTQRPDISSRFHSQYVLVPVFVFLTIPHSVNSLRLVDVFSVFVTRHVVTTPKLVFAVMSVSIFSVTSVLCRLAPYHIAPYCTLLHDVAVLPAGHKRTSLTLFLNSSSGTDQYLFSIGENAILFPVMCANL